MNLFFDDQIILLAIILLAVSFFIMEILPMEVTALGALALLLTFNIIDIQDAVDGFSNKAVITIGGIFVLSRSLVKTGFLEVFANALGKLGGKNAWVTISILFFTISIISGFINNTAAVAIFIPVIFNICQRFHISPTKLLLPLSYAAIFGGTLTLIGTSTNLIVSSVIEDTDEYYEDKNNNQEYDFEEPYIDENNNSTYDVGEPYIDNNENFVWDMSEPFRDLNGDGQWNQIEPISMFELTEIGLIFLFIGLIYTIIISKWVLPSRAIISSLTQKFHMRKYLTEFKISSDSLLIGKTFQFMNTAKEFGLQPFKIIRKKEEFIYNLGSIVIEENDVIIAQISLKNLMQFKNKMKVLLLSDVKIDQEALTGDNFVIVEGLIPHHSSIIGKTLNQYDFKYRFSAFVLALQRQKEILREKIAHIKIKFSDTLLIMVPKERLAHLRDSVDLIVLEELDIHLKYQQFWWLSILVIPVAMILASLGIVSIVKGIILGAILLLVLKVITINEAYESIDWSVIFLIAALVPIGHAIGKTESDITLGNFIYNISSIISSIFGEDSFPKVLISIVYFISFILSSFLSNAAVAVVLTPIAITLANLIGIDPRPIIMAVCLGASNSFLTPIGYQTNMMVYGPGQYKFKDFMYVGLPLSILFWILATYLIPKYWQIEYLL